MTTLEGHYAVEMQIRREKVSFSFDRLRDIKVLVNENDRAYRKIGSVFFGTDPGTDC